MAKNDNRNFNTLQRALSADQNTLQSLAGRLTSDGVGGVSPTQQFVVDGLVISSTGAATIGISPGTASITNPSVGTLEPQKLLVSLRTAASIAIPVPATWYTVSCSYGTATSTNAVIGIYNPTTQTFSGVNSLVQTENNLLFTMTAGTANTFAATPANHMLLGYVQDTLVLQAKPTQSSTTAKAPQTLQADRVVYDRNTIVIDSTGTLSGETWLTTSSYGSIYNVWGGNASSIFCDGVALTNATLYHLYILLPASQPTITVTNGRSGTLAISDVAPSGNARTATLTARGQFPAGTGIYCGSLYFVSGVNWLPWTINGNEINMTGLVSGYFNNISVGAAASAIITTGSFAAAIPPNRQRLYQMAGATGTATSGTVLTMYATDGSGTNIYDTIATTVNAAGNGYAYMTPFWVDSGRAVQASLGVATGTGTFQLVTNIRGVRF